MQAPVSHSETIQTPRSGARLVWLHRAMKKVRVVIIRDYVNTLTKFSNFLDEDLPIEEITRHPIEAFLAAQTKVSNKTLLHYHAGFSALI